MTLFQPTDELFFKLNFNDSNENFNETTFTDTKKGGKVLFHLKVELFTLTALTFLLQLMETLYYFLRGFN